MSVLQIYFSVLQIIQVCSWPSMLNKEKLIFRKKDTDYKTSSSNPPSLCNMGTSVSYPQCTILEYKIHEI